ncbi:TetR/AcrR family transcriptional regulator [Kitasatospora viridis]|uniref:TetR family transcriptional regulator n=1 Tax=Kitasatospora viridis TaxID=281105 RepID=A0A561UPA4_9ACTN|nr:TetR/AcrR family transcriptional regulator [Kitasatospora viridis]TWG01203.1 TetR family transcriptional regulator [Kitasatospora viridis]
MSDSAELDLIEIRRSPPKERADASRNRVRILDAAARLFGEHGVDGVSLDAIAAAAGVGKGTLFRRFGSKANLAAALLDAQDSELQTRILFGPPPLGPGAPADQRIIAFVQAYLELLFRNLELVRLSETAAPSARYQVGSYQFWRRHLALLVAEARPELDAEIVAHALLAPLGADLQHSLAVSGHSPDRITPTLVRLVADLLGARPTQ